MCKKPDCAALITYREAYSRASVVRRCSDLDAAARSRYGCGARGDAYSSVMTESLLHSAHKALNTATSSSVLLTAELPTADLTISVAVLSRSKVLTAPSISATEQLVDEFSASSR